jgi:hypothetical protein
MIPAGIPAASKIDARIYVVVVLPAVPVIPIDTLARREKIAGDRAHQRARPLGATIATTGALFHLPILQPPARAPRFNASSILARLRVASRAVEKYR